MNKATNFLRQIMVDNAKEKDRRLQQERPEFEHTPDCPPISTFAWNQRPRGWKRKYRYHFQSGCHYCKRMLQLSERYNPWWLNIFRFRSR